MTANRRASIILAIEPDDDPGEDLPRDAFVDMPEIPLRKHRCTVTTKDIVDGLRAAGKPLTTVELAGRLGTTRRLLSGRMNKLADWGVVQRKVLSFGGGAKLDQTSTVESPEMSGTYPVAMVVGEHADVFKALRLRTTDGLLARVSSPRGRITLAEKTGLSISSLLDFANACDLMRIKGLSAKYINLLRAAGVPTVRDLKYRNAGNLFDAMAKVNRERGLVDFLPPQNLVGRWISQAKQLPLLITYR